MHAALGDTPTGRDLTDDELIALLGRLRRAAAGHPHASPTPRRRSPRRGEIGYPVVLKSTAPWLRHRSDLGGVRLDLTDADAVRTAFAAIPSGDPVIVQEMAAPGVATVVEVVDDPSFGALVSFGLGGVATDLLGDRAYRTLPLTDLDAAELVRAPRAWPLLDGYRGSEPVDVAALEDLLLRVARLADDLPEVLRLRLEPVIVGPADPWHGGRSLVVAGGTCTVGPPTARVEPGSPPDAQRRLRRRSGQRHEAAQLARPRSPAAARRPTSTSTCGCGQTGGLAARRRVGPRSAGRSGAVRGQHGQTAIPTAGLPHPVVGDLRRPRQDGPDHHAGGIDQVGRSGRRRPPVPRTRARR